MKLHILILFILKIREENYEKLAVLVDPFIPFPAINAITRVIFVGVLPVSYSFTHSPARSFHTHNCREEKTIY